MLYFVKFIYNTFLLPPGIFIVLLFALSGWLYRRDRKVAIVLLAITTCFYTVSTPLIGEALVRSLENRYSPPTTIDGDIIVMLGGGSTLDTPDIDGLGNLTGSAANRLLTTARLHFKTSLPILISSGKVYSDDGIETQTAKRQLIGLGVQESNIILEENSRNTAENALNTKQVLTSNQYSRPVLVTSAFHMERSVRNFDNNSIKTQPYPTDYKTNNHLPFYPYKLIPTIGGLTNTYTALHEYLGILALYF